MRDRREKEGEMQGRGRERGGGLTEALFRSKGVVVTSITAAFERAGQVVASVAITILTLVVI